MSGHERLLIVVTVLAIYLMWVWVIGKDKDMEGGSNWAMAIPVTMISIMFFGALFAVGYWVLEGYGDAIKFQMPIVIK